MFSEGPEQPVFSSSIPLPVCARSTSTIKSMVALNEPATPAASLNKSHSLRVHDSFVMDSSVCCPVCGRHGLGDKLGTCCIVVWTCTHARLALRTTCPAPMVMIMLAFGAADSPSQSGSASSPFSLHLPSASSPFPLFMQKSTRSAAKCEA
jgi:hypothetical protein